MVYTEIVIAGCGNPLFADDGFGIAIAEELKKIPLPENITVLDTGTSAPVYLFPLLDPVVTKNSLLSILQISKGDLDQLFGFKLGISVRIKSMISRLEGLSNRSMISHAGLILR